MSTTKQNIDKLFELSRKIIKPVSEWWNIDLYKKYTVVISSIQFSYIDFGDLRWSDNLDKEVNRIKNDLPREDTLYFHIDWIYNVAYVVQVKYHRKEKLTAQQPKMKLYRRVKQ